MKQISIQTLKESLSAAIFAAESGNTIVITRHNQPVARLVPAYPHYIHRGVNVGKGGIRPAIKRAGKIPYVKVLNEDRGSR